MKNKKTNEINLKKLTIARITMSEMVQVHGGSSHPTTIDIEDSYVKCNDSTAY
ncbi:hypothetical protein [uncultured Aquimarina sp.]|uniref:hypothetical protein n=1 Tax=uncultured Aquimarina sp. TaxID=575652 RepID=UPI00260E1600|nr:hypothetical protein [uncultured Aquimarina sp.]